MYYKKIHIIYFGLLFCFLSIMSKAYSQEYSFTNLTSKNGLAGNQVYTMAQDSSGFIWFGTESGLSRFDGSKFVNYTSKDGLPDNEVLALFVDSKNRLWISYFKNAIAYYSNGRFYTGSNDSVLRKLVLRESVNSFSEDSNGNIYVLDNSELNVISNNTVVTYSKESLGKEIFGSVGRRKSGGVWLGYGDVLYSLKSQKLKPEKRFSYPSFHSAYSSVTENVLVWRNELYSQTIFVSETKNFKIPFDLKVLKTLIVKDSIVAICKRDGVYLYDLNDSTKNKHLLQNQLISYAFIDNENNWWFSTLGKGVFKLNSQDFLNYRIPLNRERNLSVTAIEALNSTLILGTDLGYLYKYRLSDQRKIEFKKEAENVIEVQQPVSKIVKLRDGNYLIGTPSAVFVYDSLLNCGILKAFVVVKDIYEDETGELLLATSANVISLKRPSLITQDTIWPSRATAITKISNSYYIGTLNGLRKATYYSGRYKEDKINIISDRISSLKKDRYGGLWIATLGNGVFYIKNDSIIKHFDTKNGLISNICRSLAIDESSLWITTDKGVSEVNLNDKDRMVSFAESNGLASEEISSITTFPNLNLVAAGSSEGFTVFRNQAFSSNSKCVMRIIGFRANDSLLNWSDSVRVSLSNQFNNVEFEYTGISFTALGDVKYFYRLMGFDSVWKVTDQTVLNYTQLPSGNYEFQIRAQNRFGIISETISLPFLISKGFWELSIVRFLLLALSVLFIYLIVRWRLNIQARKNAEAMMVQNKITELEQQVLRTQMNPHFIYNSLNSIQQYVIDKDVVGANQYISSFSKLLRKTLDLTSKTKISLYDELSFLENYLNLERMKFEDDFKVVTSGFDDQTLKDIWVPPLILQPFAENAIRHGVRNRNDKLGRIEVHVTKLKGEIQVIIQDNGIGMNASRSINETKQMHQSKGLLLSLDRINNFEEYSNKIKIHIEDADSKDKMYPGVRIILSVLI